MVLDINNIDDIYNGNYVAEKVYKGNNLLIWRRFYSNYLTIEMLSDGTLSSDKDLSYSWDSQYDKFVWLPLSAGSTATLISGRKYRIKSTHFGSRGYAGHLNINGNFNVYGNINSLKLGDDFKSSIIYTEAMSFIELFMNSTGLISAQNLVIDESKFPYGVYLGSMFRGCTSLVNAPKLPSVICESQYSSTFRDCTSLVNAPELPSTNLTKHCYYGMFRGCTSLVNAPVLPSTTLAQGCYEYMFNGCTSLTTAPDLLATTATNNCYEYMFKDCTNLNYIKCLLGPNQTAEQTTWYWTEGVTNQNGTFVKNPNRTWSYNSSSSNLNDGVPDGWTIQNNQ